MDEATKKKKGTFSFLRAIGLGSNNEGKKKDVFAVKGAVKNIKSRKQMLDEAAGN